MKATDESGFIIRCCKIFSHNFATYAIAFSHSLGDEKQVPTRQLREYRHRPGK